MIIPLVYITILLYVTSATDAPIVGILAQESSSYPDSYIAASYVKFVESAGARAIPVWIGQDDEYYQRVVNYTNGILFPGGSVSFNNTDGYGQAAIKLYALALEANDLGITYPLWGTCLGMEVIPFAALKGQDITLSCNSQYISMPLKLVGNVNNTRLFSSATVEVLDILTSQYVTNNNHQYCLTEEVFQKHNLSEEWRILSTNIDDDGLEYISSMEHKYYPFYAVQFHPEKNAFEFKVNIGIPHSPEAVRITQYFANFFVKEVRKNNNSFPSWDIEQNSLIYNFETTFTGIENSSFLQIYQFRNNITDQYQLK